MKSSGNDREGALLFRLDNGTTTNHPKARPTRSTTKSKIDLAAKLEQFRKKLTNVRMAELVDATGIPEDAWAKIGPGWCDADDLRMLRAGGNGWADDRPTGAWCLPEYDGAGRLVGLSLRATDGRKGAPSGTTGAKRGLTVPTDLHDRPDPVLVVEGATDVAACCALGITAVGRPSNRTGASDLAQMLDGREVLVIGERDGKPGGAWPGRDGAKVIAQQLAARWGEPVKWTLPPEDVKDLRDWFAANPDGDGAELLAVLVQGAKEAKRQKRSTADRLVDLALQRYRFAVTDGGEAFAVERDGPAIAIMFRGGTKSLRAKLSRDYREMTGKTPNSSALSDALVALEGQAVDADPETLAIRIAEHDGNVVLDLGDASGRVVVISRDGWDVRDSSPVLFRRTALSAALPVPADEHDPVALNELRDLLNVSDDAWSLVVGWLVAAYILKIPHPIMMLGGEHGTGKSTTARLVGGIVDPSPAQLRSQPRNEEAWAVAAAGSWCVTIDNVSKIPTWWSDALCKCVTGDGWLRRKLYSDSDLAVLVFKRCVILTSIDAGALRGDLGDRLLLLDLERIEDADRRTEDELDRLYSVARPRILAGLLSAVSSTLAVLPDVKLNVMPRMADFARVLAALDRACPNLTGGRALDLFVGQRDRIAYEVVESDPVAMAVLQMIEEQGEWEGTATDLLETLTPKNDDGKPRPPSGWPKTGRGMAGQLKRILPALRVLNIDVERRRAPGGNRDRRMVIRRLEPAIVPTVPNVPEPDNADGYCGTDDGTVDPCGSEPSHNRPVEDATKTEARDGRDDRDGSSPSSSDHVKVRI